MEKLKTLEDAVSDLISQEGRHVEAVVVCAFYPEQWQEVRETIADPERLPEDYGVWFENVQRAARVIESSGRKIQMVYADIHELNQWCKAKGYTNDTQARALFAAFKAAEKEQERAQ